MPAPTAWHLLPPAERRLAQLAEGGRSTEQVAAYLGVDPLQVESAVANARERLARYSSSSSDGQREGRREPGFRQRF